MRPLAYLLLLLVFLSGCEPQGSTRNTTASSATPLDVSGIDDQSGKWTYRSEEYSFTLDFPSTGWKQRNAKNHIADFWCRTGSGSPMLVGVSTARKETRERFDQFIQKFKLSFAKDEPNLLEKPIFKEGNTVSGHPYVLAICCEKGSAGSQFFYVVTAAVWLKDKQMTIGTVFEGQGQMQSKTFKSIEYADFERAALSICLSPR